MDLVRIIDARHWGPARRRFLFTPPFVYWHFDFKRLIDAYGREPVPVAIRSDGGTEDPCHHDIHHLSPNQSKALFYNLATPYEEHLRICGDGGDIPFDMEMMDHLVGTI